MEEAIITANGVNGQLILYPNRVEIKANRKNALKGGVKTEKGKNITRMNADFCKSIYNCFMPVNEYENQMVEILLSNILTFRRICLIEKEYIETKLHPDEKMNFDICLKEGYKPIIQLDLLDDLNKFQKYKTSIQNNIIKIEHELESLIANRLNGNKIIPNSIDVNITGMNGFVFEN